MTHAYVEIVESMARAADTSYERMVNALSALRAQGVLLVDVEKMAKSMFRNYALTSKHFLNQESIDEEAFEKAWGERKAFHIDLVRMFLAAGEIRPEEGA